MKKKILALILTVFFLLNSSVVVLAHSGRTDSLGGHYNRKAGNYHYHKGKYAGYTVQYKGAIPAKFKVIKKKK